MAGPDTEDDSAYIVGNGDYAIEVVSGSRHQDRLEWLAQGRGDQPAEYSCIALLTPETDNPFDPNAVSVSIQGVRIGYLPADAAASMTAAMRTWGFDRATCDAIVEGGWYASADDKGDFCVLLDVNRDFTPVADPDMDVPPPQRALAVANASSKTAHNVRSVGFGAIATAAMLALIGVGWLIVQLPWQSVMNQRADVAPAGQTSETQPRREAGLTSPDAREAFRSPSAAEVKSGQPLPIPRPSTSGLSDLRPAIAVTEAAREARPLPSPEPARALMPAVGSGAVAARTAETVDRKTLVAAAPAPAADELRRVLDPRRSVAVLASPIVNEIVPLAATAITPRALRAMAQADRPAAQADRPAAQPAVPSPGAIVVAVHSPDDEADTAQAAAGSPRRHDEADATRAGEPQESAPDRKAAPVAPPARPSGQTARLHSNTEPDYREPRSYVRSRAAPRAAPPPRIARANGRTRSTARYSRRTIRPAQAPPQQQQQPIFVAPRPAPPAAFPPGTMATRMLEGYARELTGALPGLTAPRRAR